MSSNDVAVAACSRCGGNVTVPRVWAGTSPPLPTCSVCGGVVEPTLPVVETRPARKHNLGLRTLMLMLASAPQRRSDEDAP